MELRTEISSLVNVDYDNGYALAYPPRAFAVLCSITQRGQSRCVAGATELIDLQHEYPGETFYAIDDWSDARMLCARDRDALVLEAASSCIARGVDPNRAFLYCLSEISEALELLARMGFGSERKHDRYSNFDGLQDSESLFILHCLAVRATCLVGDFEPLRSQDRAQRVTRAINDGCGKQVLFCPRVRPLVASVVAVREQRKFGGLSLGVIQAESCSDLSTRSGRGDGDTRVTCLSRYEADVEMSSGGLCRTHFAKIPSRYIMDTLRKGARLAQSQARITVAVVGQDIRH